MKLHQIIIIGNKNETYPKGFTCRDFNLSTTPFVLFLIKALGRGKDLNNIQKLNIILFKTEIITTKIEKRTDIETINKGGFDFDNYFNLNPVDQLIMIATTVKNVLNELGLNPSEVIIINEIIDKIISNSPNNKDLIQKILDQLKKDFDDQEKSMK